MMHIDDFAQGLSSIPEDAFTDRKVLEYVRGNRVDVKSLAPYLYFSREHYARNLVHRTPLFELIAICWEPGQRSAIHNHRGQRCWMAMAYGKVQVHNFRLVRQDPGTGYCELEPSTHYIIDAERPAEVDREEPIHQVSNPVSFGSRAVTLHVYSWPYNTCEIYDLKAKHYEDVRISNTTEFGVVKSEIPLEKAAL